MSGALSTSAFQVFGTIGDITFSGLQISLYELNMKVLKAHGNVNSYFTHFNLTIIECFDMFKLFVLATICPFFSSLSKHFGHLCTIYLDSH